MPGLVGGVIFGGSYGPERRSKCVEESEASLICVIRPREVWLSSLGKASIENPLLCKPIRSVVNDKQSHQQPALRKKYYVYEAESSSCSRHQSMHKTHDLLGL
jgi:hypothetical protein